MRLTEPMGTDPNGSTSATAAWTARRPSLCRHVRQTFDAVRERDVLLAPEAVLVLNPTGAAILRLCDGARTVDDIVRDLSTHYDQVSGEQVRRFLTRLEAKRFVEFGDA